MAKRFFRCCGLELMSTEVQAHRLIGLGVHQTLDSHHLDQTIHEFLKKNKKVTSSAVSSHIEGAGHGAVVILNLPYTSFFFRN